MRPALFSLRHKVGKFLKVGIAAAMLVTICGEIAFAQLYNKWLDIGSMSNIYNSRGAGTEYWADPEGPIWPAQYRYQSLRRANGLFVGVKNFTDAEKTWIHRVTHVGPRSTGFGEVFEQEFELVSRYEDPEVQVDGLKSFLRAAVVDRVDPTIEADRIIRCVTNNLMGIKMEQTIYAFEQAYHDNYHVTETVFTNTGNVDDDPDFEFPDQTLEGVIIWYHQRQSICEDMSYYPGHKWETVHKVTGDGMEADLTIVHGDTIDFRATYTWKGNTPGGFTDYKDYVIDPLGGPMPIPRGGVRRYERGYFQWADSSGRLSTPHFEGIVTLSAAGPDGVDDVTQPRVTGYYDNDHPTISANSAWNVPKMAEEYAMMMGETFGVDNPITGEPTGHIFPDFSMVIDADGNLLTADGDPMPVGGGIGTWFAYGPYELGPGKAITLWTVEAASGLSREAAIEVGRTFKEAEFVDETLITYHGATMTKNEWFFTGEDSLLLTFTRAKANKESGWAIPEPPRPPTLFKVTSGVDAIELEWEVSSEGPTVTGFEVYRTKNEWAGDAIVDFKYDLIAELGPTVTSYTDDDPDLTRGIGYFYHILSVGDAADNDGSVMTPPGALKSARFYTQTYDPAILKRPPGEAADFVIVPNPYNLAADPEVRWPDMQDKIAFLDIPGECTIKIYTELGELIRTLDHTDGSGDEYWNLTTSSNQVVVSGIYIVVLEDTEGDKAIKKLAIIR